MLIDFAHIGNTGILELWNDGLKKSKLKLHNLALIFLFYKRSLWGKKSIFQISTIPSFHAADLQDGHKKTMNPVDCRKIDTLNYSMALILSTTSAAFSA